MRKSRRTLRKSSIIKQYYQSKRNESKNRKYVDGVKNLPDEDQLDYDLTTEKVEAFGCAPGYPKPTSPKPKSKNTINSLHKKFKRYKSKK